MKLEELMERAPIGTYVGVRFTDETIEKLADYQHRHKIPNPLDQEEFHTTVVYSRKPINWRPETGLLDSATVKKIEAWNTRDGLRCVVLLLDCDYLKERFDLAMDRGATYDFPDYKPHITLSYDVGDDFNPDDLPVPDFEIELDHEYVEELNLEKKFTKDNDDD